jgi:molybdopterin synthase sulfur carrier subunit
MRDSNSPMVKILYFAGLREATGSASEEMVLPADVHDIAALRDLLRSRGGAWADALADSKRVRAAVNQDMAAGNTPLADGDEIAFFPPVTGG